MYITEYHHHTDNSFDSKASMFDVCAAAVEKGIDEICFTEHFAVNPKLPTYGHMNFERYFSQIAACRKQYEGQLIIKAGIELCEPHLLTKEYAAALDGLALDFVMGSVHNIQETKLRTYLVGKDVETLYRAYFEEILQLVSNADIDVLAHLDLMKRYAIDTIGNYQPAEFQPMIEAILKKAIERGIGIEINTSGLANKKLNEPFPSVEVLKMYQALGGEILTIGSDSHRADTVGAYLDEAIALAKEVGFDAVYTFEKRKPVRIPI